MTRPFACSFCTESEELCLAVSGKLDKKHTMLKWKWCHNFGLLTSFQTCFNCGLCFEVDLDVFCSLCSLLFFCFVFYYWHLWFRTFQCNKSLFIFKKGAFKNCSIFKGSLWFQKWILSPVRRLVVQVYHFWGLKPGNL